MDILIKGGRIVDPATDTDKVGNLFIKQGKIDGFPRNIKDIEKNRSVRTINAKGKIVSPGFVDINTNLGEPGYEHRETIRTGSAAAAAGGFTTVVCMPDTAPVNDNASVTEYILFKARTEGKVNILPIGALTKELSGSSISEIGGMQEAGCVAISDAEHPVMNSRIMRLAMEYAKGIDIPVFTDCQDLDLLAGGVANEGYNSTILGLKPIPSASEDIMVARNLILSDLASVRLHICHVSTSGAVALIRDAKRRGLNVTAEVAPHHFSLTDDAIGQYRTVAKTSPPLRTAQDVAAIKEGLHDGTIDVIATNHRPHTMDEIKVEFDLAPFGISSLETALSLSLQLVGEGVISINRLIENLSVNPSNIISLGKGTLKKGSIADVTIFDENEEVVVDSSKFFSKGKNTPFNGMKLRGRVNYTIVGGKVAYSS